MTRSRSLTTRPLSRSHEDLLLLHSLFEANGMPRAMSELQWRYIEPPTRRTLVHIAIDDHHGRPAAAYCVFPSEFLLHGTRVTAAQSLDTITDFRYRGLGLFKNLARSVYEQCRTEDISFVYGFPNNQSGPGFFGRLGWRQRDPVPFMIRPIRMGYFLRRLGLPVRLPRGSQHIEPPTLGAFRYRRAINVGPELNDLWSSIAPSVHIGLVRDATFLQWRYLSHPTFRYEAREVYDGDRLVAFGVYRVADKHGGRVGYLMEMMVRPGYESLQRVFASTLVREMSFAGAELALAWHAENGPYRTALNLAGFVPLPERLRPIQLHFGWLPLSSAADTMQRPEWFLSYSDSDTV